MAEIRAIKYAPIYIALLLIALKGYDYHYYHKVANEDGIIEYLTSLFFLVAAAINFAIYIKLYRITVERKPALFIYLLLVIAFTLIAFEEISWGQRIFGFQTPASLKEINVQDEFTLHNISYFHEITMDIYILIGLWGTFSWIIFKYLRIEEKGFTPPAFLSFYFLPILISATYLEYGERIFDKVLNIDPTVFFYFVERVDNEPCEMLLSLGFTLFFLYKLQRIGFPQQDSNS